MLWKSINTKIKYSKFVSTDWNSFLYIIMSSFKLKFICSQSCETFKYEYLSQCISEYWNCEYPNPYY